LSGGTELRHRKTSVKIVTVMANIWNGQQPNTSLECSFYTTILGAIDMFPNFH
jgi:hypothetical protein